jgi:hypothetical protein
MEHANPVVVSYNNRFGVLDATDREGTLHFIYDWNPWEDGCIFTPEALNEKWKSIKVTRANASRIDRAAVACVEFLGKDRSKVEIWRRHHPGVIDSEQVRALLAVAHDKVAKEDGTSEPRLTIIDEPEPPVRKAIAMLRRAFHTFLWGRK